MRYFLLQGIIVQREMIGFLFCKLLNFSLRKLYNNKILYFELFLIFFDYKERRANAEVFFVFDR